MSKPNFQNHPSSLNLKRLESKRDISPYIPHTSQSKFFKLRKTSQDKIKKQNLFMGESENKWKI